MMQEARRMKLTSLLERLEYEVRQGSDEIEVTELVNESRKVTAVYLYVLAELYRMDILM